jgi:hypothetical protein
MSLNKARADILRLPAIQMTLLKLNQAALRLREYSVLFFPAIY